MELDFRLTREIFVRFLEANDIKDLWFDIMQKAGKDTPAFLLDSPPTKWLNSLNWRDYPATEWTEKYRLWKLLLADLNKYLGEDDKGDEINV